MTLEPSQPPSPAPRMFPDMEPPPNQPESRASESQEARLSLRSLASGVETFVSHHEVATKAAQLSESLAAPDPDNA